MIKTVRTAFLGREAVTMDLRKHRGTSEYGQNFTSFYSHIESITTEFKLFYKLLQNAPIISSLNAPVLHQIFKNSAALYITFSHILSAWRQRDVNENRFYIYPNMYLDLQYETIVNFLASSYNPNSLAKTLSDYSFPAKEALTTCVKILNKPCPCFDIFSDVDVAIVILLVVIQSSLSAGKDPSAWGDLVFLLSELQFYKISTTKIMRTMYLITGSSVLHKVETSDSFVL
ncbi:hypothetical protein L596_022810 [Steinernema carpocapsae]|uniref:NR LBD domain-containing protein n=1 Tax=Steinernema carpocapsae TaxID=34508 RepID=A0A4U5MMT3_STECR|nr:hypothetical protein L596_022810 [Steinernema carpocapsae]